MDSHLSGIERFILSVKKLEGSGKFYFNVFTYNSNPLMCEYIKIKFFYAKKIMNRSIPLRCESIKILLYF